jgi:Methyltransferase domain
VDEMSHFEHDNETGGPVFEAHRPSGLSALCDPALDPFFWNQPRPGLTSAWHAHVPFAHWLVQELQPRIIVELGTYYGVSYSAFCEAVIHGRLATRCYAVDTWLGDEQAGYYGENVFQNFRQFHDLRYSGFSQLLRTTFDEALPYFAPGSVDLLHLDGLHTFEAANHDYHHWFPKLSSRAVVLFHDTNVREHGFEVWRLWEELRQTRPSFEFLHGYGLGVLVVGDAAPSSIVDLCTAAPETVALVRDRFAALGERHALRYEMVGGINGLRRAEEAERRFQAIEGSSTWRATKPLRRMGERFPSAARLLRRVAKLVFWTVTFQLFGRYRSWHQHRLLVRPGLSTTARTPLTPGRRPLARTIKLHRQMSRWFP